MWRWVRKILLWTEILVIFVLCAGLGIAFGALYQMNKMLPADTRLDHYQAPAGTKIYSQDGVLLATLAVENRQPVTLEEVPKQLQDAVVAIEDSRFYTHPGVDFRGLMRAIWVNLTDQEMAQGGSTITQQLARAIFLDQRKLISRKAKEMLLAVQIERNWPKRRILEAYLNQVYLGSGAYGVKAAAEIYFGKELKDLTLPENALLAGLLQRPSDVSPYVTLAKQGNTDRSRRRRDVVLNRMAELGFISREEAREAKESPVKVVSERPSAIGFFRAKYFVQAVVEELRHRFHYDQEALDRSGLKITTSLNWKLQQVAESVAKSEIAKIRKSHRVSETALVCLDPHTGRVLALVGGVNEPWEKYQFNCATHALRQPGSTFKLFVYTQAMEEGDTPYSGVSGGVNPIRMADGKVYAPKNHGGSWGRLSYQQAFAASANGAAVNLCVRRGVREGPRRVIAMARRLGLKGRLPAYPSLALGTGEATPLEMASAYGVFAARGRRATPTFIARIEDQSGRLVEDVVPEVQETGLKPSTVASMDILTRAVVTSGTGWAAKKVPDAHGKTGTTEDYTDAWFCGYTPDLACAVWAGNRDNSQMRRVYGATIAVPIWTRFMEQAVKLNPSKPRKPEEVKKPADRSETETEESDKQPEKKEPRRRTEESAMVRVRVCSESGDLATSNCPDSRFEEYTRGEQPARACTAHGAPEREPAAPAPPGGTPGTTGQE